MERSYTPVKAPVKKSKAKATTTPQTGKSSKPVFTIDKIRDFAAQGYTIPAIAQLLGKSQEEWDDYYEGIEDEVDEAIRLGRLDDEIQCTAWLRYGAKNCGNFSAFKYYVEWKHGWGSGGGGSNLPKSISFTMIEPEDMGDEDAD